MRVMYDLPPDVIGAVEGQAGERGQTVDEYVAERLGETSLPAMMRERVKQLVEGGMSDADIAATLHCTPGWAATIRRSFHLPANRRYRK